MKLGSRIVIALGVLALGLFISQGADADTKKYKGFTYWTQGKNVVIDSYKGNGKKVVVPEKINGKKVTKIDFGAFRDNKKITEVKIPDTITEMDTSVFENCKSLKTVDLGGIKELPYQTFGNCVKLKKVIWKEKNVKVDAGAFEYCENLESIGDHDFSMVESSAFLGCKKLKGDFTFSSECVEIGRAAFAGCELLNLTIPDTVKSIEPLAFMNCKSLTSITIPDQFECIGFSRTEKKWIFEVDDKDLGYIDKYYKHDIQCLFNMSPFVGCTNVKELIVKDTSGKLIYEDGVLYNHDKSVVLFVLPTKTGINDLLKQVEFLGEYSFCCSNEPVVELPNNIQKMLEGIFYGANVKEVKIGSEIDTIPDYAFTKSNIEKLVIPEGVTNMGTHAVSACPKLKSISIPKSLSYKQMGTWDTEFWQVLQDNPSLEKITVAKGNKDLKTRDGVLFWGSTLVCYPAAKKGTTYKLPKNCSLDTNCFDSLKYLRKIVIPEKTKVYCSNYIRNCKNLKVYFPRSVKQGIWHMGDFHLFDNCSNCYAMVYKKSFMHKFMKKHMPENYKIR